MGKISSTIIESLAVHAIESLTLNTKTKLESEIPVGDRGVSFDGGIKVYSSSTFKKDTLLGFIPVQVKGQSVNHFSLQAKFQVNIHDLQNYYNAGGIIFFLTQITGNTTNVFSKVLLPLDIKPLLKRGLSKAKPNRKTPPKVTINLDPVKTYEELEKICMYFIKERKRQPPSYVGKFSFHDQDYEQIKVTSLSLDSKGNTSDLFGQEMYAYGINKDVEHPISIIKLNNVNQIGTTSILIGGKIIEYHYSLFENKDKLIITFENTLTITYENNSGLVNLKFEEFQSLNSYRKTLNLIRKMYNDKSICLFNDAVQFNNLEWNKEEFIDFDSQIEKIPFIEKVFKEVGISSDYFTKSTSLSNLAFQINRFLIEKNYDPENLPPKDKTWILRLFVDQDYLLVYYSYKNESYKSLNINDFNDVGLTITIAETNIYYPVSPFLIVSIGDFIEAANTNIELVKKSFHPKFHTYNETTFRETNRFCIDCINKYDQDKDIEYLNLVIYIGQLALENNNTNFNKAVMTINLMQAKIRKNGSLNEKEQQELVQIKEERIYSEENLLKFCCNVLLQNKVDSNYYFSLLSTEEKNDLKDYPINYLYENLF